MISDSKEHARHETLYDIDPRTGASIEVFYSDRTLETFGRCGPGWFWWSRRRGFPPVGPATGPFATGYAAYRHAMLTSDHLLMLERLENSRSLSMCRAWDMDEPTQDATG